ncbi:type II toxin-antitoxin system RelE/ParE family toxin [Brenneria izadpanahii]|uniref:Type II toxin-antitoxin system RelE/ParE family toxin n=1 Tax=Brenneria izadpanahii TaxID=2722756 RepID=A0ABX7UPK8_9GAMM|nr:type II toxin-antitoxin system RelE/ParE family toxin [Brenneria izadpanahii]QTF07215.1 type II toxin-antitoxin system RelE/ParE family toxin [Brenneria izadpanahii]
MDLAIYTTKLFDRKMKKEDVTDVDLCQAAADVMNGDFEADLGGGVLKKRLALQSGKSGGARSIIFFKKGSNVFFFDGWRKNQITRKGAKEIEEDVLKTYKDFAEVFLQYDAAMITRLKKVKQLREVNCDGC